ncbi:MAG: tetratricopeptide repeat protein [Elusimicrobiota bacterium]|jgi:tetratricopeptide (TPR) repeat protein|nr:tetratricopeptide repeat protein [Elusimicrobiota bacterium]
MDIKAAQSKNAGSEVNNMDMGKFYFLNNKFEEAVEMFNKVIETNPLNAEAYYNIGLIKESSNDIEEAKRMYQQALNINKDYAIAQEKLNNLMGIDKDE